MKIVTVALLLIAFTVTAAPEFKEGVNYKRLPDAIRNKDTVRKLIAQDPGKVQLLFFFSFGCPYCAKFDPIFEQWAASQHDPKVVIYRFPQTFESGWGSLAKLYYVMQDLKPYQDLNADIFNAIHQQDIDLEEKSSMQTFFVQHGYSAEDFNAAYTSSAIGQQLKFSSAVSDAYGITEIPTIVINGPAASYQLNYELANDNYDELIQIIAFVIVAR